MQMLKGRLIIRREGLEEFNENSWKMGEALLFVWSNFGESALEVSLGTVGEKIILFFFFFPVLSWAALCRTDWWRRA